MQSIRRVWPAALPKRQPSPLHPRPRRSRRTPLCRLHAAPGNRQPELDLALCHALEQSIAFVREKGNPLDPDTVAALDDARAACTR